MQTRRQWLMRVAGGAVLSGWSGVDLAAAELPPGVYEPSRDHLGHALARHPLEPGGETELIQLGTATFQPLFFKPEQYHGILEFVALVLGEPPEAAIVHEVAEWIDLTLSDAAAVRAAARALSPLHRTLAIHYYGAESVRKLEDFDAQKVVRDGFAWIGANPLSQAELKEILAGSKSGHPTAGFFAYLRERVIDGFYTSRAGLEELGYRGNAFYNSPPGCEHLYG